MQHAISISPSPLSPAEEQPSRQKPFALLLPFLLLQAITHATHTPAYLQPSSYHLASSRMVNASAGHARMRSPALLTLCTMAQHTHETASSSVRTSPHERRREKLLPRRVVAPLSQ